MSTPSMKLTTRAFANQSKVARASMLAPLT